MAQNSKSGTVFAKCLLSMLIITNVVKTNSSSDEDHSQKPVIITTQNGALEGLEIQSRESQLYFAFLGIKYGEIRTRFETGRLWTNKWTGVKLAKTFGNKCPQFDYRAKTIYNDEDCLYLNVYTPKLNGTLIPVMVFIHGGSFMFGSADGYGAKYLMDENIVLVTINYRLGALGFLNTEDGSIGGNMGLKDQTLALEWVAQNIVSFGGDPTQITLFGESAGGASVHFHLLSDLSRGLFHKAISQSGSALCPWALMRNGKDKAEMLGDILKCPHNTTAQLKDCLKMKSVEEIINAQIKFHIWFRDPTVPFGPSIELLNNTFGFLTDTPYNVISQQKKPKIPFIMGLNANEGILLHAAAILSNMKQLSDFNHNRETVLPISLFLRDVSPKEMWSNLALQISKYYFNDEPVTEDGRTNLTNMYSDRYFNHGIQAAIEAHVKNGHDKIFPYMFSYKGNYSFSFFTGDKKYYGVGHMDELPYLFNMSFSGMKMPEFDIGSEGESISKEIVKLWANFAKFGKPQDISETWQPIPTNLRDDEQFQWYVIDTVPKLQKRLFGDRLSFWNNLPLNELQNEKQRAVFHEKDEL